MSKPNQKQQKILDEIFEYVDKLQGNSPSFAARNQHEKNVAKIVKAVEKEFSIKFSNRFLPPKLVDKVCGGDYKIFDHLSCVHHLSPSGEKIGKGLVSQPYHLDQKELMEWAARHKAGIMMANEWSFHYPTHTGMFIAIFP